MYFVCLGAHVTSCMYLRSEDNIQELILSFCRVGPGNPTKVVSLGGKRIYLWAILLASDWHL